LTSKNQITLPKEVLRGFQVHPGIARIDPHVPVIKDHQGFRHRQAPADMPYPDASDRIHGKIVHFPSDPFELPRLDAVHFPFISIIRGHTA
jgi:hypothetical protein